MEKYYHMCSAPTDFSCEKCEGSICENCTTPFTIHNQCDYNLCKDCDYDNIEEAKNHLRWLIEQDNEKTYESTKIILV